MRFAVISDVHGNLPALEAVLADIAHEGADAVFNLGDCVAGPVDPVGTADVLMALGEMSLRGNHDRWLADPGRSSHGVDAFVRDRLRPDQLAWATGLKSTATVGDDLFLCHGTPTSDEEFWLEGFWADRVTRLPSEADVLAKAEGLDFPVLLCGHTHLARSVRLRDGRIIVNPGAVGLQFVHGSPDARYALVERRAGQWTATFRIVPYNRDAAAELAEQNGFAHWREALLAGWADPDGLF